MMKGSRLKNKYVQLFCIACFKGFNIRLFDRIEIILCPHCNINMTVDRYINKGIKTFHLKLYEKCA